MTVRRSGQSGFSLIELVVATAILGTAVVGLLSLTGLSLGNAARVAEYDRAAMLARMQLTELRLADPLPLATPLGGEYSDGWSWSAQALPFQVPSGAAPGMEMLVRIELELRWTGRGGPTHQGFEAYKRMEIRPENMGLLGP